MPLKKAIDVTPITANGIHYRIWEGGRGVVRCNGVFGAGALTLSVFELQGSAGSTQALLDAGANYTSLGADTTFTADGLGQFYATNGSIIALILTGATAPTVYASVSTVD